VEVMMDFIHGYSKTKLQVNLDGDCLVFLAIPSEIPERLAE
jgi:hypothetical protein